MVQGLWRRGNARPLSSAPGNSPPAIDNADERFATYYGLWVGSLARGELGVGAGNRRDLPARSRDDGRTTEAGLAVASGLTCLCQGDFIEAQAYLEQALRTYDPERDRDAKFRFGHGFRRCATAYLAHTIGRSARSAGRGR